MAPPTWTTKEQLEFLIEEDVKWAIIKDSGGTLKSFYLQMARTFLEKWPSEDLTQTPEAIESQLQIRIANWYTNQHRQKKAPPAASKPVLDLAGKGSCKKPPLQKWQAFSSLYYHPRDSPLRAESTSDHNVRSGGNLNTFKMCLAIVYDQREANPSAVEYLSEFLPPDTNIATLDRLTFLGAFSRERCTRLSSEEVEEVQAYIEKQQLLAAEHRDCPWFLDDNYEDKPLLAENRYIQQRIDELPRVSRCAIEEIEKATGFKAILLVGGLTPANNGAISTHIHTSGHAVTTNLSFVESWGGCSELRTAFGEWLQMAYTDEEKARRQGYSASSLTPAPDAERSLIPTTPDGLTPTTPGNRTPTPPGNIMPTTPGNLTPATPCQVTPMTSVEDPVPAASPSPESCDPGTMATTPGPTAEVTPLPEVPPSPIAENIRAPLFSLSPAGPTPSLLMPTPPMTPGGATGTPHPTPLTTPPSDDPKVCTFTHDQTYPAFITPAIIEQLNTVEGGPDWVEMMRGYLKLESEFCSRRVGKLSLQNRPEEVVLWGCARKSVPSIADIQQFHEKWLAWWRSCQPNPSGLFALVISTSWWANTVETESQRKAFDSAVEDLRWVVEKLISFNSKATPCDPVPADHFPGHSGQDPGKRQVKPTPKASNRT
ncbi:hypothetical protein BJ322DRAFT_1102818 [Thelephora terrestris]|uniref:Uncharacterized protein n=1 Tax=Thelephora terrestris TaxID=56493 RepID=A0A9P6HPJ3_9AGAM|nr:hypothetical protein BJ322DRAFT_1102818 [Thelephora terrestris]